MTDTRVLIADDDAAIRSSLRELLESEPGFAVAGEARDGDEAVELALRLKPDVVLMDVQMPTMTGLEAAQMLCARPGGPSIIMLTTFDVDEFVYQALRAGAAGFLLKNCSPTALLGALRAARDGSSLLAPEVTRRLIERLAPVAADPRVAGLSARQRETLALIAQGRSNDEIAASMFVTPTTARTYVSRLLAELGARDRAQLVVIAYESGFVAAG